GNLARNGRTPLDREIAPVRVPLATAEESHPGTGRARVLIFMVKMAVDDVADDFRRDLDRDAIEVLRPAQLPGNRRCLASADGEDLAAVCVPEGLNDQAGVRAGTLRPGSVEGVEGDLERSGQRIVEDEQILFGTGDMGHMPVLSDPERPGRHEARGRLRARR